MANTIIAIVNRVVDAVNDLFHIRFRGLTIGDMQVIPANREFLAVLGDQMSGRNIEAPEALLRQMAQEAASANTELLQAILAAIREGHVIEVDRVQFGRTVKKATHDVSVMSL